MDKKSITAIALKNPKDKLSAYAVADLYEELGDMSMAFTWRWMGWHNKRPAYRRTIRTAKYPWAWYREHGLWLLDNLERQRAGDTPWAFLHYNVYSVVSARGVMSKYTSSENAINALSNALKIFRSIVEKPVGID